MKNSLHLLILYALILSGLGVNAQISVTDSITAAILSESDPHEKLLNMGKLVAHYGNSQPDKGIEIAYQAVDLSKKDHTEDLSYCYNMLGLAYLNSERYDSAMFYFDQCFKLAEEERDTAFISKSLNNIGIVYFNLGEYQLGLEKMEESGWLDHQSKNYENASISYSNIGAIQLQLGDYEKARISLTKALGIAREANDKLLQSDAYLNLGVLEMKMDDVDAGKAWTFKAVEILEDLKNYDGVAQAYNNLAFGLRDQRNYSQALIFDFKSLEYAEKCRSADAYSSAYYGIALDYEMMGNYSGALDHYKMFMSWRDTIQKRENNQTILELKEKFNTEQTQKENQILIKENQIKNLQNRENQSKLRQSNTIIISSITGLVLLLFVAFVLFNRNRIKQRANAELSMAYETIQKSNAELQIASDIIQEKNKDITSSIEYASKIQEALLPTGENPNLFKDSFFILMPKDIVSGDFIWYTQVGDKVLFAAADCTGHGVPGAFMSMIGNSFLNQIVVERKILKPADILDQLRIKVITALSQQKGEDARKDGMDMAICMLDKATGELQFAGANNPLYFVKDGEMNEIKGDKQPVGFMPERDEPFKNYKVNLKEGDAIYIFSDGYADQFGGPKGKKFKYKQMRDLLHLNNEKPMKDQKEIMLKAFYDWKGDLEQIDDVCMIGVRV